MLTIPSLVRCWTVGGCVHRRSPRIESHVLRVQHTLIEAFTFLHLFQTYLYSLTPQHLTIVMSEELTDNFFFIPASFII